MRQRSAQSRCWKARCGSGYERLSARGATGVQIVSGVLSREHVHMFVEIPPHIAVSDFARRVKGRSSHRVQMEFPDLRKRYWGRHFWARGYFSTTSGNITDDVILQYLQEHEPTGVSRYLFSAETRTPIQMKEGRPARFDYEYERNGTANLVTMFAPLEGWRHVKVTDRHFHALAYNLGTFL